MYLSWADDVPIVYPPYTCATGNVQDECLTLMGFMSAGIDPIGPIWSPKCQRRLKPGPQAAGPHPGTSPLKGGRNPRQTTARSPAVNSQGSATAAGEQG
jgi:hypothetical protein